MTKITQKKLIESLSQLKEIKPRKEWAVLLKSQILASPAEALAQEGRKALVQKTSILDIFSSVFFPFGGLRAGRKLAYAFSVILLFVVGVFGFAEYTVPGDMLFPMKKIAEQSQAALTGQTKLNQDVATLNSRINDLAQVAKAGRKDNIPSAISEVSANASQLAKSLKDNPVNDPQTLKEIAISLKTLADVQGTDLTATPGISDLYQTLDQNEINDYQKTTLTEDQQNILAEAEDLYSQGKYYEAFEKILTIGN